MKKTIALLMALGLILSLCACTASAEDARIMTSFYPIQIIALNVFAQVDGITVDCMAAPETGCLHDYQLLLHLSM